MWLGDAILSRLGFLKLVAMIVIAFAFGFATGYTYNDISGASVTSHAVVVRVSTTTSLYQTGLLDVLLNDFRNASGVDVRFEVLARGSGEALRLLADGSACIGFVHAPPLELRYIRSGAVERLAIFAYNEFVVVGPSDDPANVSRARDAVDAFKRIFIAGEKGLVRFVSRGDFSGTHMRELLLWNLTGLSPEGRSWYLRSGKGMAETLIMADNLKAYTLTDVATFTSLKNQGKLSNLVTLFRDPTYLVNVYSLYLSKAKSCDNPLTWYAAYKLKDYILSCGQDVIVERFKGLFNPVKGFEESVERAWDELSRLGS
jgi:tungstate transport system substrate-binding protein